MYIEQKGLSQIEIDNTEKDSVLIFFNESDPQVVIVDRDNLQELIDILVKCKEGITWYGHTRWCLPLQHSKIAFTIRGVDERELFAVIATNREDANDKALAHIKSLGFPEPII